jgi:hypothetical protein
MPEKNVRPRDEIKVYAKGMERRMREKQHLIANGDWLHWKQMSVGDLIASARGCLDELEAMDKGGAGDSMKKSFDLGNFARFIGLRLTPAEAVAQEAPEEMAQDGDEE